MNSELMESNVSVVVLVVVAVVGFFMAFCCVNVAES